MAAENKKKNYRRRKVEDDADASDHDEAVDVKAALEEVRLLQSQRQRTKGLLAEQLALTAAPKAVIHDGALADEEGNEELVLQDTFALETAVHVEDPNMLIYVEQELAKRRGVDVGKVVEDKMSAEDDLYRVPDHLKVKRNKLDEGSTAWTTGIAEVQLPIEYKVKNIEETEAAKKALQQKRPFVGRRGEGDAPLPASFSADYFQRGKDYAEKLRRGEQKEGGRKETNTVFTGDGVGAADHPDLFKDKGGHGAGRGSGGGGAGRGGGGGGDGEAGGNQRRQAATDEIMMDRFRKRERNRMMRR